MKAVRQLVISINGVPLENPMQYHRTSPMGIIQLVPNNAYGVEPSVSYIVSDTHSFIISPPAPGQYIIDLDNIRQGHPEMGHLRWIIDVVPPTVGTP